MTVPMGLATYVFLPDTPYTTHAWFLTQIEKDMAAARVLKAGKAAPAKLTVQTFKNILSSWKWYAFVLGYTVSITLPCPADCSANWTASCLALHAAATATSRSGSNLKDIRLSIETSYPRELPLYRRHALCFGDSCQTILRADSYGY